MPRTSTQTPPKYSKHKATGRAYVTLDGRAYYLGKYGSAASKAAYSTLIAEWIQGGGHYRADAQQEITVAEILAAYIQHARGYYTKNGKPTREYGKILESARLVTKLYSRSPAVEFGPIALETVRLSMINAGHSRSYINSGVDRIRRIFKWAAAKEMIPPVRFTCTASAALDGPELLSAVGYFDMA